MTNAETTPEPDKDPADPMAALHLRLAQKQAECARDYDAAHAELAASHKEGEGEAARLQKLLDAMAPVVDRFLASGQPPTPDVARTCQRYLATVKLLGEVQEGRRAAYGATTGPGEQPLGGAIGDPSAFPIGGKDDEA